MRSRLLLVFPLLLAGCASTTTIPESRTDRSIVSVTGTAGSMDLQLTRDAAITSGEVLASPDKVWLAVTEVYALLELPVTEVNSPSRLIASSRQRVRRIGGKSVASYFNCPGTYGNAANNADVYVVVRTQVLPGQADTSSLVRTEVEARARSATGANSSVTCSTNGSLEKRIIEAVAAQVDDA